LDERRPWAALVIHAAGIGREDLVAAILDDFSPAAIEDLAAVPLPPDGAWDPTFPPPPEPPAPLHWRVFFNTPEARSQAAASLRQQLPDLTLEHVDVPDEDWAARSQRSLAAIRVDRFIVAPPWDLPSESDPAVTTIVIEPSRGFGTGHHASTRLCLRALSAIDVQGKRVLDLGTGSGVLAMAAACSGAREVLAIDVDPDAIEAARASAALNALPVGIEFGVADFRDTTAWLKPRHYDLVLANLTGGMLMRSASRISELVAPGGVLVMSGFDEHDLASVREAFNHLRDGAVYAEEGWIGLVLRS
jgi:ribosomal protein L11 methyltransferase